MKKVFLSIFLFFSLAVYGQQSAEELNTRSKGLLEEGRFEEAFPLLKKAAEMGNGEAQYNLGYFLQSGVIGGKNVKEALEWYKKSSDNNFNDAHYALMMAYGNGNGVEQNSSTAFSYAMKCAQNNDPTCMWNVVNCYLNGKGTKKDSTAFKEWILRLAKLENPENLLQSGYITGARLELAHFYAKGEHFAKDDYQCYVWYLIYNEGKVDFSVLQQNTIIQEIKELEKRLNETQLQTAPSDAEKLLGRSLTHLPELYKNSLNINQE